jgi:hypothetical protein
VCTSLARPGSGRSAHRCAPHWARGRTRLRLGRRSVAAGLAPLVDGRPRDLAPVRHGRFVARASAPHGLLRAPADRRAYTADRPWRVADTKRQANHRSHAASGPEVAANAIGGRTWMQEVGHAGELLGRQPAWGAGRGTMPQRVGTSGAGTCHPLTDGPFADAKCFGDPTLGPALLLELPGWEPPGVFPSDRCSVHP